MDSVIIFGIDPGLYKTGWGVIQAQGRHLKYVASGHIQTRRDHDAALRLSFLFNALKRLLRKHSPHEVAIEEIFVNKNPLSSLKLGFARGAALLAPGEFNIPIYEYTANCVKKSIVGNGHAGKDQVAFLVTKTLFPVETEDTLSTNRDVTDALAVAMTHAHLRCAPLIQSPNRL